MPVRALRMRVDDTGGVIGSLENTMVPYPHTPRKFLFAIPIH